MRYFILFLIINISIYGLEEPNSKKQKLSHVSSAPAAAAAAASSSSSYVYPAVANARAYAAAAAASSYSPSFSSVEIPLKAKLSNIIEASNKQITFPIVLSQMIIDKVKPYKFEEIGTIKNVSAIFSIAWSPNGDSLASSGRSPDVSVKIWSTTTGEKLRTLMKMGSPSNYISWNGNSKLLSVSETGKIIFWSVKTGKHLAFNGDVINYDTVSFCHNSLQFAYISGRSLNNVYFVEKQIKLVNLLQHNCKLTAIAYSHDGTKLAISDINGSVFFIDADSQEDVGMGYNHEGIESLHWSPEGNKLVSQSPNCIKVWDCNNNAILSELALDDEEKISSIALSPDGNLVAYSCLDCVRIWDIKNNQLLNDKLTGFTQGITCIAWAPDSKRLAAGSLDKTIKIWGKTLA